jgi:hypothetical protein
VRAKAGPADRVRPWDGPDHRGFVLDAARHALARTGWLDPQRHLTTEEGAVVHRHAARFVRRLDIEGTPVYAKVFRPLERGRSPIVEFQHHLALRAAGFRAAEPWFAAEGRLDGVRTGVLVTREARGLPLDETLALALPAAGPRARLAMARGLGTMLRALHTARFLPRDLQAWHLFVEGSPADGAAAITLIDLARLERGGRRLSRRRAALGLAALALSLEDAAPGRFRLAALQAYLGGTLRAARPWIAEITRRARRLRAKGTFRRKDAPTG